MYCTFFLPQKKSRIDICLYSHVCLKICFPHSQTCNCHDDHVWEAHFFIPIYFIMNYLHVLIQIDNQSSLNRKKRLGGGSGSQIQINTGQLQFGCFDFSVLKTVIFHIQQNQFPAGLQDSFCVFFAL